MKWRKSLVLFLYVVIFVATFLAIAALMVASFDIAEGQEEGYPEPEPYPGYVPVMANDWDVSVPTLPAPTPLPTSTPSPPPTEGPCDMCWTCNTIPCYEFCLESCGCFFNEAGKWCIPCIECEGGVRCRN